MTTNICTKCVYIETATPPQESEKFKYILLDLHNN